jgi:hypothetical protein
MARAQNAISFMRRGTIWYRQHARSESDVAEAASTGQKWHIICNADQAINVFRHSRWQQTERYAVQTSNMLMAS